MELRGGRAKLGVKGEGKLGVGGGSKVQTWS